MYAEDRFKNKNYHKKYKMGREAVNVKLHFNPY